MLYKFGDSESRNTSKYCNYVTLKWVIVRPCVGRSRTSSFDAFAFCGINCVYSQPRCSKVAHRLTLVFIQHARSADLIDRLQRVRIGRAGIDNVPETFEAARTPRSTLQRVIQGQIR